MKLLPATIFLTILTAMGSSCREEIDIVPPSFSSIPVANSLFCPDSTWTVSLYKSKSVIPTSPNPAYYFDPIDNANVTVSDPKLSESETVLSSVGLRHPEYRGGDKPAIASAYRLRVEIPGREELVAESSIPAPAQVRIASVDSSNYEHDRQFRLTIQFKDSPGPNYYRIVLLKFISGLSGDEAVVFSPINPALDNNFSSPSDLLFDDNLFDGKEFQLDLNVGRSSYTTSSPLRVVLISCSPEYYKYISTTNLQNNIANDPFAEPVQIYSNINNGLGIFAGYSASSVTLE